MPLNKETKSNQTRSTSWSLAGFASYADVMPSFIFAYGFIFNIEANIKFLEELVFFLDREDYELITVIVDCIISLSSLVGLGLFQLAVKLAKIFEWKCKSNWEFQVREPAIRIGDTCHLYTGR